MEIIAGASLIVYLDCGYLNALRLTKNKCLCLALFIDTLRHNGGDSIDLSIYFASVVWIFTGREGKKDFDCSRKSIVLG